jgi:hypothetical protein
MLDVNIALFFKKIHSLIFFSIYLKLHSLYLQYFYCRANTTQKQITLNALGLRGEISLCLMQLRNLDSFRAVPMCVIPM